MKKSDFPPNFAWGAATAAYQIEGAAASEGRGPCIWDVFSHINGKTRDGDTGDVACDHYHRYEEDVALMKSLGISDYRLSISWSRVLPQGRGNLNPLGLDFYHKLLDCLLANNIRPSVTLYHWDLPQALQEEGGWPVRSTVEAFVDYANMMFEEFGDKVSRWYTHNEPWVVAWAGHFQGRHAPGISDNQATVSSIHHLVLSHALTVAAYRKHKKGRGEIGIVLNLYPVIPASGNKADVDAARLADEIHNRSFLDPVFCGKYPTYVTKHFEEQACSLPILDKDMSIIAANPGDFLGINYYFRKIIKSNTALPAMVPYEEFKPAGAWYTEMQWEVYAEGLTELLRLIKAEYGDLRMLITECGAAFADPAGDPVPDLDRQRFLEEHFSAALDCIREGIKLEGFYVWSLMDNFEWAQGYSKRFGLFAVDYESGKRTWKRSALWYRDFLTSK